ncbi:MAG: Holliday junction resolvase RuvX [Pseudomonadota bacterium]
MKSDPLQRATVTDTYLGFDFGDKKIGIAVGTLETGTASPLTTLRSVNQKPDWSAIGQLIEDWKPAGLVVGVSYQKNGSENPVTPLILRFCRQLEGRYRLPVFRVDESLSTFESKQLLYDDVRVNAGKLWAVQDQLAAQLILQTWLNTSREKTT